MIKTCARCGKEFEARHGNAKYCSDDCRRTIKNEQHRQYYAENPEKRRESSKRWRDKNPDKVREQHTRWVADNPEKVKVIQRRNYTKYREERTASSKLYYAQNREKVLARERRRREERKHQRWVKMRAARLRKILEAKATKRKAELEKRRKLYNGGNDYSHMSSCSSTYIY